MAEKQTANRAPSGFRKVETSISGFWKPTRVGQSIQGIVGHAVEVAGKEGQPNTFYTLKLTDENIGGQIATQDDKPVKPHKGMVIGIGGKALLTFLREREGKEVFLSYKGLGVAKKGQSAPKLYDCYERGEPDSEDDIPF